MNEEILRKCFLSYTNMLKTVEYRGYIVNPELLLTKEEFDDKYKNFESADDIKEDVGYLIFSDTHTPNTKGKLLLRWVKDKKFGASARDVSNKMREENILKALIVSDEGVSIASKDVLKNLKVCYNITIDIWTLQESMIFPPDHILTPKHRICTNKEKKNLYKVYGLTDKDLPRIKPDDVMVKYLGATRKQVIEITRKCDTNPKYMILNYRIVM